MTRSQALAHIEREMERRELTAAMLARMLTLSKSYLSRILSGEREPPAELLALFGLERQEVYKTTRATRVAAATRRRPQRTPGAI